MVSGWSSTDGETWTLVGERAIESLPATLLGGVAGMGKDVRPDTLGYEPLRARISDIEITSTESVFLRGDCNDDGAVDISDAVCILNWLFVGDAAPGCIAATNTNGDDAANISDATYLLDHLFLGKAAPVAPFPDCGPGMVPADTTLGCANPPNCQ